MQKMLIDFQGLCMRGEVTLEAVASLRFFPDHV